MISYDGHHSRVTRPIKRTNYGEIDQREKKDLTDTSQKIHRTVQELMVLTFAIYCPLGEGGGDEYKHE